MALTGKAEYIIEEVAGCGIFQVILSIFTACIVKSQVAFVILFMSFGNYNPGWRCMDNQTGLLPTNSSELQTTKATAVEYPPKEYTVGSCEDYNLCKDVQFNPESSTILTEWGLICDRSWIISVIISIQMIGMLVGSYISGILSDFFGRKLTLYLGIAVCGISQLISTFSFSWPMFLVLRFIIGTFGTSNLLLTLIYLSEYMTRKWRAIIIAFPFWYIGATLLAIISWACKDWRQIEFIGFVVTAIAFLPIIWVPESLRWLEVKNKNEKFMKVSQKIVKLNKKVLPSFEECNLTLDCNESEKPKKHSVRDLFRKGYKLTTLCTTFLHFSFSLLYYAISFGAKSLYGDFYLNLLISYLVPLPFGVFAMLGMRYFSRKFHTVIFLSVTILCSVVSVGILLSNNETAKSFGSTLLISISKGSLDAAWFGMYARTAEIYPTVVRGTSIGIASLTARVGGIIAPFLIPKDRSVLYIFMIVMAVLTTVCCVVSLKLPETKGKKLKETFEDKEIYEVEMFSQVTP